MTCNLSTLSAYFGKCCPGKSTTFVGEIIGSRPTGTGRTVDFSDSTFSVKDSADNIYQIGKITINGSIVRNSGMYYTANGTTLEFTKLLLYLQKNGDSNVYVFIGSGTLALTTKNGDNTSLTDVNTDDTYSNDTPASATILGTVYGIDANGDPDVSIYPSINIVPDTILSIKFGTNDATEETFAKQIQIIPTSIQSA
ncbi:hypothetical protein YASMINEVIRUS_1405 [Yasminevirus sp. GU-2018]|uniref:Uncharacterized protein n=1 Tax=Yasminevirus sp. GU-2018 TaxID=2420051 RepID=A0A5K0UBC0_9VIRU|nr:hypothetical protein YASMINEVIRUS_1405 [Yasminevirus sp. GU-2018]